MGNSGSEMPFCDATNGLRMGVVVAWAWMGMGTTVFDKRAPSPLMAATKAGTCTGLGNWIVDRHHGSCALSIK